MKKIILFSLFFLLITGGSAFFRYVDHDDIPVWAEDSIYQVHDENIMRGFPDGTFRPEQTINRAEALVILFRIKDIDESTAQKSVKDFTDVAAGDWFFQAVHQAVAEDWITGFPDGSFRPGQPLNRAEWATLLYRAFDLEVDEDSLPTFRDLPNSAWYSDPVYALYNHGLIRYPNAQNFAPDAPVERAEAAWTAATILNKPGILGSSATNEFPLSSARSSREVALLPIDFDADNQGVESMRKYLQIVTNKDQDPIELVPEQWMNVGGVRILNQFEDRVTLNSLEFRLRFDDGAASIANYFTLTLDGPLVEKSADFSSTGTVLFTGLDTIVSPGEEKVFQMRLQPSQRFFSSREVRGNVYVVEADAVTTATAVAGSDRTTSYRKTPINIADQVLRPFVIPIQ